MVRREVVAVRSIYDNRHLRNIDRYPLGWIAGRRCERPCARVEINLDGRNEWILYKAANGPNLIRLGKKQRTRSGIGHVDARSLIRHIDHGIDHDAITQFPRQCVVQQCAFGRGWGVVTRDRNLILARLDWIVVPATEREDPKRGTDASSMKEGASHRESIYPVRVRVLCFSR